MKRRLLFCLSATLLCALAPHPLLAAKPAVVLADQAIDQVWSGHPVSFDILTERGHQFVAYYDAERRISVAGRKLGETGWTIVHPAGVDLKRQHRASNVTGWDSHNYLRMALDKGGCLHLSGNMHNDPLVYYRTRRPFDLTTLERLDRMTGEREDNATYPVFFKNADGQLMFRYRDGGSGNGSDIYNIYDLTHHAWRRLLDTPLLDGQGQRNAYALDPVLGPDGRFHLVWMWRDTPDCSTNHTLSYARSEDFIHWEKCDGTPIPLPITLDKGEVVDPAHIREGLINMTFNLGFDAHNRPVVIYHRYDSDGHSQTYAARPTSNASAWTRTQLSNWDFRWGFSGGGSIAAEVILGAPRLQPDGSLLVDFATTHDAGAGRFQLSPETLRTTDVLPATDPVLPSELMSPKSGYHGMEVQTAISRDSGRRWVLRWETLPRNRDRARKDIPPATELHLYEIPDSDTCTAARIGS